MKITKSKQRIKKKFVKEECVETKIYTSKVLIILLVLSELRSRKDITNFANLSFKLKK